MAYTTINKSTDYFNTKLYTGNGGTNAITGVGFQPDLIWIKERSSTSSHNLVDAVRGVTKRIASDNTGVEETLSGIVSSFDSDGFTNGADNGVNENSQTYASWNWKANGAGSANTDGTINSTVSASATSGFSIVSYSGTGSAATIGHGLGVAPKAIIIKQRSVADGWVVFFPTLDITLSLQSTSANNHSSKFSSFFNSTDPTSTLISLGTDDQTNKSSETYIAYCFAEKTGYSKFGSYTGNGNADGTFVYTGFKPAFVITKKSSGTEEWNINDTTRDSYGNPLDANLLANQNYAETDHDRFDAVSNGFKIRTDSGQYNASGATYIYMAFGQSLVGSNNVPNTAR